MDTESKTLHAAVREGFQILLRADALLLLPRKQEKMRTFYQTLGQTCLAWAVEVHGEKLRREYCALESMRERSLFSPCRYRMEMRFAEADAEHMVAICESRLSGQWHEPQKSYYRSAQVWDINGEWILPIREVLQHFGFVTGLRALPFRPDGAYPEEGEMVFFRNATDRSPFLEQRLPCISNS